MRLAEVFRRKFDLSFTAPRPAGAEIDDREPAASEMVPYQGHYDDETVVTQDGGLVQVLKLDGLYYESLSRRQIKLFERRRNTVLRQAAASDRGIYVTMVRRRVFLYPDGEGPTWFSRFFNTAWRQRMERRQFFVNEIYISVVQNRFRLGVPGLMDRVPALAKRLVGAVSSQWAEQEEVARLERQARLLTEATDQIVKSLAEYGARKLRVQRTPAFAGEVVSKDEARAAVERFRYNWRQFQRDHGQFDTYRAEDVLDYIGPDFCEISGFLYYLANLQDERVLVTDQPLSQALAKSWINTRFVGDTLSVENTRGTRAAAVLSMAEWPTRTPSRMLNDFLKQPAEFIVTQSFFFTDRISAEQSLRLQRRRLKANDDTGAAEADTDEITEGLRDLTRGEAVNGLHHLSVLVHVPAVTDHGEALANRQQTLQNLSDAVQCVSNAFTQINVKATREWLGAETFYWSQLPGQAQHFLGRRGKIKSSNFAGFASLHNFALGKIDGNLWGPAIIVLETEGGTPYLFNFHREIEGMVAGHFTLTADTGAGKTAFLAALIAMADKARPRVFWFDNREGAKVFMRAMGARHTTLTALGVTGWNPFRLPDTPANRAYLIDLLVLMRTCYGGQATALDIEAFQKAVHENYDLPEHDRRLRNIAWCFKGELAKVMRVWHGDGANAGVFDNEHDSFDLAACRYHCFEMKLLIKDDGTPRPELPVVMSYPFHRIEQSMDGDPFILVLEEGQNLVRHAYWKQKIDNYIMQIRRKNGLLGFVTPDAKYLFCETDSIIKQAATKIFLANSAAQQGDYVDGAGLSVPEFEFLRDTPPTARKMIIRRGNESIKAVFDLSDMPAFIPVLSSNDAGVALMEQVIAELGTDEPETWVPVFMQRALVRNTHNLKGH